MRLCKSEPKEKVGSNGGHLTGGTRVDLKVGTERERFESVLGTSYESGRVKVHVLCYVFLLRRFSK